MYSTSVVGSASSSEPHTLWGGEGRGGEERGGEGRGGEGRGGGRGGRGGGSILKTLYKIPFMGILWKIFYLNDTQ